MAEAVACPLDEGPVHELAHAIAVCIREHQVRRMAELGTPSRAIPLEGLNALAFNVALLLAGTGSDPEARAFFTGALEQNLSSIMERRNDVG